MTVKYETPGELMTRTGAKGSTTTTSNYTRALTPHEVELQFTAAMRAAGLQTDAKIHADGALHRFHVEGDKRLSRNGWYTLYADGIPAGAFGNWKVGLQSTWRADIGPQLNREEERQHRERIASIKRQRDEETGARHKAAQVSALTVWNQATQPAVDHPYLATKNVAAYGIRQLGDRLLIPVRDTSGTLHGLQFIPPVEDKKFGYGTAKLAHYHAIGAAPADVLALAEGYATGATIHAATGWPVAVAFDAGNLKPVSRALREKYPAILLLICADNDRNTEGNPGMSKARDAAAAVGGIVIAPAFAADCNGTDWNDHAKVYGIDATARQLLGVLEVLHVA